MNDEELFAAGTSAMAASDFTAAARAFEFLAQHHPSSARRPEALLQAGLAHQRLDQWEDAYFSFSEIADAERGTETTLTAVFRAAESLYHLDRYTQAAELLSMVAKRADLPWPKRLEAKVQQGICVLENGQAEEAEKLLRSAIAEFDQAEDKTSVDLYFPAQAQFFLGEIFRQHSEAVQLDVDKPVEAISEELEYKAQLLLSAQGHYLRAVRLGHGYWATAAGAQIGVLYENLYGQMIQLPIPSSLDAEQGVVYRQEIRKKVRVLVSKAITVYEQTLEAAERIGSSNAFVDKSRESLKKMKALLLTDLESDADLESEAPATEE